jgi:hypothetical protein
VANESTVIRVMSLPEGRDWVWFGDLNVIGVSDRLDEAGQMVAVLDLQSQWRKTMIEVVPPRRPSERCRAKSSPPSYAFMHNASTAEGSG